MTQVEETVPAEYPDATIERTETDSGGGYESHIVTGTESGGGRGGPGFRGGADDGDTGAA